MTASISIIIVSYNTVDYLQECLESVYAHTVIPIEVIVVDNASTDASVEMVKRDFPLVKLIVSEENLGFGLGNNLGVEHATGEFVMLFNSDALLTVDSADILSQYLIEHPDVACICPRVVLPKTFEVQPKVFGYEPSVKNVWVQSLGLNRLFPKSAFFCGVDGDHRSEKEMAVGWVSGVCMMMRRQAYQDVGGFDKRFFMYCEDVELCLKLARFGKIISFDGAQIIHYGGASSKSIAAKIRNSVWQQRHLLIIVEDYFGKRQAIFASAGIFVGLCVRLMLGMIGVPKKGFADNEVLQSAWARLKDLFSRNDLNKVNS